MTTRGKATLAVLLWLIGASALLAVVPVVMPFSWMMATHAWLGLGQMPNAPVVEYLARSVSAFYALFGALCLVVASDLERYRVLARFLGLAFAVVSVVFTGVDIAAGMPWWWSALEGPPGVALGAWMYYLARPGEQTS